MSDQPSAERLWQLTVEHSPVGMTLVGPDGALLMANRALCAMLGYSEDELRARTWQQITHPEDLEVDQELFGQALAGQRSSYRLTKRYLRCDGSVLWGDLSVALLRDDDGAPVHFISQINDVTGQRLHQAELAEAVQVIDHQRRMSRAILDTVDVGLLLIDRHGHYESMNRRHGDFLALAFPEGHRQRAGQLGHVYAADSTTLLTRDEMPSTRAARGEEFDDRRIWVGEDPLTRRALSVSARPVRGAGGVLVGAALAYSDVTDLMRALQSREDFLAAVSHELRTPLTSVLGHLEMLLEHEVLPATVHQLRVVQRNAQRLRHLVSDLLESAQQREGNLQLVRSAVDVAALVRDAVESAQPTAAAMGVTLVAEIPSALPAVVDHERLRQVVDNLVSNALKYTDAGGRVDLGLSSVGEGLRVEVSDSGIGIAPDDLALLFTPFFRAQGARTRMVPGVGLGLGIARAIVAAHGGRLEVTSTPGEGSRFVVSMPLGSTDTGETEVPVVR